MFQILVGPIIGCVIGYITNSLAIHMLFRPHKAHYLGKWKLPFTPGLIPKEKSRIAESIGSVVSGELLNNEVFLKTLTSERILNQIGNWFDRIFQRALNSQNTLRQKLYQISEPELMDGIIRDANLELSALVGDKLKNFHFGEEIARQSLESMRDKYRKEFSLKSILLNLMDDGLIQTLSEPLGRQIDTLVSENSEQIVSNLLDNEVDKFLDVKICDLAERYEDKKDIFRSTALDAYCRLVQRDLHRILEAVNLSDIVEERINSYDVAELEKLLKKIMKKELRAIVWLGALLGFFMGFLNSWIHF